MRVSTNTIFGQGLAVIQQQQVDLLKTQQQLATGRRMLTPADDPVASSRALEISQSMTLTQQWTTTNLNAARGALQLEEGVLTGITEVLQNVRERAVLAGNPVLSKADQAALATELRHRFDELVGLANGSDGTGQYLFSGYQSNTAPFVVNAGVVSYKGDDGQRRLQVGATRQMEVSNPGSEVFKRFQVGGVWKDAFKVIGDLADALDGTVPFTSSTVAEALEGLDKAMGQVIRVQASVGARLKELDSIQNVGSDLVLQYQETLSNLQDIDFAEAVSRLNRQNISLDAAQKSYLKVTGLSLFNFIGG